MLGIFIEHIPQKESCWRAIVLMGRNVASYKFALAKALLSYDVSDDSSISLNDLALPYALNICEHLQIFFVTRILCVHQSGIKVRRRGKYHVNFLCLDFSA